MAVPQDEVKIIVLILRVPNKDGRLEPLRQLYLHGLELGRQEVQEQPLRQPVGGERLFIPLQQGQNLLGLLLGGHGVQVALPFQVGPLQPVVHPLHLVGARRVQHRLGAEGRHRCRHRGNGQNQDDGEDDFAFLFHGRSLLSRDYEIFIPSAYKVPQGLSSRLLSPMPSSLWTK